MELWIRSQDKRILQKVDNIFLNANYENRRIYTIDINDTETELGEYKTKERALEVLDEIQGRITSNECLITMLPMARDIRGYEEKFGALFKEMVYEMPIS